MACGAIATAVANSAQPVSDDLWKQPLTVKVGSPEPCQEITRVMTSDSGRRFVVGQPVLMCGAPTV